MHASFSAVPVQLYSVAKPYIPVKNRTGFKNQKSVAFKRKNTKKQRCGIAANCEQHCRHVLNSNHTESIYAYE